MLTKTLLAAVPMAAAVAAFVGLPVLAEQPVTPVCANCHADSHTSIAMGPHGAKNDAAGTMCMACHGDAAAHAKDPMKVKPVNRLAKTVVGMRDTLAVSWPKRTRVLLRRETKGPVEVTRKKLPRKTRCPCGSGKKYGDGCYDKGFEYMVDEEGNVFKSIPISDELAEVIEEQKRQFIEKHGREPGPDDKLFFDMPPLEHAEHFMVQGMQQAGIDPAFIYAFEKTGLLREAIEQLHEQIARHPSFADSYLRLGDLYTRAGNDPAAMKAYLKAVDLHPCRPRRGHRRALRPRSPCRRRTSRWSPTTPARAARRGAPTWRSPTRRTPPSPTT